VSRIHAGDPGTPLEEIAEIFARIEAVGPPSALTFAIAPRFQRAKTLSGSLPYPYRSVPAPQHHLQPVSCHVYAVDLSTTSISWEVKLLVYFRA
jgi:hypothetical protein